MAMKITEILLVEDNPADVRLTQEALKQAKMAIKLNVVADGAEALDYLYQRGRHHGTVRPDLVLLDLNLPKIDGRQVLTAMKADEELKRVPVVVLTTSQSEEDIWNAYSLHANCYVCKPVDFQQFQKIVNSIEEFWLTVVNLPPVHRSDSPAHAPAEAPSS